MTFLNTRLSLLAALCVAALLLGSGMAAAQVDVTIQVNDNRQQGASTNGNPLLYAPDPVRLGSSISHWDNRATPNLLMEPAINSDLDPLGLDLTDEQMKDIGWTLSADVPGGGSGSTFNIFPADNGFFDPRPFPGAPGNPATTLGEARQNLFIAVLGQWAGTLESSVDIDVIVLWTPLFCDPNAGATLAAAGTTFIFNDASLPFPDTWYHAALTEALVNVDVTGSPTEGGGDLVVFMNSDIDEGCLGEGTGYYYGLDGNDPANQIDIAPVILHEAAHGLGFANFVNETTGESPQGLPGIYDWFTNDIDQARVWAQMTPAERRQSAVNFGRVEWVGANAAAGAQTLLDFGVPEISVNAPADIAGNYDVGTASFGPAIPDAGLNGTLACYNDSIPDASPFNACSPATNPGELDGKIALIDRGTCGFTTKVKNAQDAGAIAAVIVNNAGNTPLGLGGSDDSITIPAVSVGRTVGNEMRAAACGDDVAFIGNTGRFQATAFFSTDGVEYEQAKRVGMTRDTTYFWFFGEENVELVVKALDGCSVNDNYWIFASGLTNVEVVLTITDTQTGAAWQAVNPLDQPFQPIQDTSAFGTCP